MSQNINSFGPQSFTSGGVVCASETVVETIILGGSRWGATLEVLAAVATMTTFAVEIQACDGAAWVQVADETDIATPSHLVVFSQGNFAGLVAAASALVRLFNLQGVYAVRFKATGGTVTVRGTIM